MGGMRWPCPEAEEQGDSWAVRGSATTGTGLEREGGWLVRVAVTLAAVSTAWYILCGVADTGTVVTMVEAGEGAGVATSADARHGAEAAALRLDRFANRKAWPILSLACVGVTSSHIPDVVLNFRKRDPTLQRAS